MDSKNKYENFTYTKEIKTLLNHEFSENENKRFLKLHKAILLKNLKSNYIVLFKDIYILFEIYGLTTKDLSGIYNVGVRTIQKWIKDFEFKKPTKIEKRKKDTKKRKKEVLPEPVEDFLNYLESIKGKSENTILAYKTDLKLFLKIIRFLKEDLDEDLDVRYIDISDIDIEFIQKIKLRDLYAYLKYVDKERDNNSHAKARKVATLKSFFNFLNVKLKVIKENPAAELESPKIEKRHPVYLSLDESLSLLKSLDKMDKNYYRDYCILTLFLNCGLRLSELCSISINKISGDTLTVIGKGNKERTIYLNDSCIAAISNYLNVRDVKKVKIGDRDKLFISRQNRAINKVTVENLVKKHIFNAGIKGEKYSPHKLRHTAATLMYQHGDVDIRTLQSILGHESVSTTQIYTHLNDDTLREAVKANPLSNLKQK